MRLNGCGAWEMLNSGEWVEVVGMVDAWDKGTLLLSHRGACGWDSGTVTL